MSVRVINLANGGQLHLERGACPKYVPTEKTVRKLAEIKKRMTSTVSTDEKIRRHNRQRELFKFGNCNDGSKLIDDIFNSKQKPTRIISLMGMREQHQEGMRA